MNKFRLYFCCILVLPMLQCFYNEEKDCNEPPPWCNSTEPSSGTVEVRISTKYLNDSTNVIFYNGKIENASISGMYRQTSEVASYDKFNGYISASIKYTVVINGKPSTVTSVDGGTLDFKSEEYCDQVTCYKEGTLKLDLRLDETLIE
jgi:hypothetical protein